MNTLEYIESMIIRPCNLSCQGCTTFSDLKWTGYTSWEQGKSEIKPWLTRLQFESWGVMGGEPLMNPDLKNWLRGIRDLMPKTQIRIVTNGLLLNKHRWIVDLLHELGNSTLKISYHLPDSQVDQEIEFIQKRFEWKPVTEYGINRWLTDNDYRFQIARPAQFIRTFRGTYDNMMPHDSLPSESFDLCVQKRCPMMYKGIIYKCGTAGLTPDLLERFNYPNRTMWEPFINTGLSHDCSDDELTRFVQNFGHPHKICRQCPTSNNKESLIDHSITVERK